MTTEPRLHCCRSDPSLDGIILTLNAEIPVDFDTLSDLVHEVYCALHHRVEIDAEHHD
ncbi:hypothetical protein LZG04_11845 [Saccharothrix sp. S26]|uniref:hypothetical protein n=1 Tax=Saccharothrix sp. S26 TaxID=2907215 RepID=UPI001F34C116|nr:hypothetical protein [Saccharothrix sp. S26]MCE6995491.1 hypothetical protein [Saccharothrix sp. S26]